jgi:hypothetical protein
MQRTNRSFPFAACLVALSAPLLVALPAQGQNPTRAPGSSVSASALTKGMVK